MTLFSTEDFAIASLFGTERNMSESQWTANVKRVFKTFSGLSPPPKLLRR